MKASTSISKEMKEQLLVRDPRTPVLYGLPKTYKCSIRSDSQYSRISSASDSEISGPEATTTCRHTTSYIKKSEDFLNKLWDIRLGTNHILVSFNIVSLFTDILTDKVLQVIKQLLIVTATDLFEAAGICLTLTYFF